MALGARGANPIWSEVDLQGNLFDDNFYLFVLENTIPYIPAVVYHDPNLNVPWTNPIQFLSNGTLPLDIYFAEGVYRLEFRQNNGIDPPSQSDLLIYEVDNFTPFISGEAPIDSVSFASSNQITNPQFALTSFSSPLILTNVTNPNPIEIGPGWFLELAGTGDVTVQKIALNNLNANPSNAPYALQLTLNGWDTDSVFLRQRFQQNGMLWANKFVSSTLTSRVEGVSVSVHADLIDSNGSTLARVLDVPSVDGSFNEFTGYGELPDTTNPDMPPSAYIDYKLSLPSNVDIYLTSIQLVVQQFPVEPSFEQDSIERQIDHTYNKAYPIVPVGTIIDFGGFGTPIHYVSCDGAAYNRQEKNQLFEAMTHVETVSLTNTLTTFTVVSSQEYGIGMPLEGLGIQPTTVISNIVGNIITMSLPATASNSTPVRFFAAANGNGSTTFNVYNLQDFVIAGAGGSGIVPSNMSAIGRKTGASTHALSIAEMPNHNHPGSTVPLSQNIATVSGPGGFNSVVTVPTSSVTVAPQGGGLPHSIVQPTAFMKKCIRFE